MVKNIKVFDSIKNIFNPPVRLYTGPIHKIYADRFELERGQIKYKRTETIVNEKGTFIKSGLAFWNIDYDIKLPDFYEASAYCENSVAINEKRVKNILIDPNLDTKKTIQKLDDVSTSTGCIFYVPGELVRSSIISRDEYKQLVKQRRLERLQEIEELQKVKRK